MPLVSEPRVTFISAVCSVSRRVVSRSVDNPLHWTARWVVGLCLALGQIGAQAHDLLGNQLVLQKATPKTLLLNFQLDPAALLHKALASAVSLEAFLTRYAEMPAKPFAQELNKAQVLIAKDLSLVGGDGKPLKVLAWTWPTPQQWQDTLRIQLMLYKVNPNDLGHAPRIAVGAEAQSLRPLSHVQLSLPRAMQPTWVQASRTDQFWLNEQIPMAVVSF